MLANAENRSPNEKEGYWKKAAAPRLTREVFAEDGACPRGIEEGELGAYFAGVEGPGGERKKSV